MTEGAPAGPPPPGRPRVGTGPAPGLFEGLGFRLSSLFAVALLPLGLGGLVAAYEWLDSAREQSAAVLVGDTMRAAARESRLIHEAQGAALALAQVAPELIADEAACDAVASALKAASPQYSVVAFVPRDGLMTCASDGATFDYAPTPLFHEMLANGFAPRVYVQARGPVSGVSVVLVVHPILPPGAAEASGYVGLALPHAALSPVRPEARPTPGASVDAPEPDLVTFNAQGEVLTATLGLDRAAEVLPRGAALADLAVEGLAPFIGRTEAGVERAYAVVPLVEGSLYALGSVPARQAVSLGPIAIVAPFLMAALMWAASLIVAWVAAERLVTRHMRRLSRAIRSFASGSRVVGDLDVAGAPSEIREVSTAFMRMTDTILHDEAELEDIVHQKEVLLREVHHRVKNNLQLIASIMNMQMRRARSPETRALMLGLQERVMSLATVHKELYQTTGLADVRADELLGDLTRQILSLASGPDRRFQLETDFAPLRLTPDQAVPLSLLLTEGLTNAIKYAEAEARGRAPRLMLAFGPAGPGRARLSILNGAAPARGPEEGADGTGLGRQLIAAFASQLGGEVQAEARLGAYELRVDFPLAPLEGGEERRTPAPVAATA